MINIACALWDANRLSKQFSRHYTEADVCALYRGFKKHLSVPFRFIGAAFGMVVWPMLLAWVF